MSSFNTYSGMNNSFYTLFKGNLSLSTEVIAIIMRNKSLIKLIKSLISILILIRRICFFFVVNSCYFIVVNLSCFCSQSTMSNKSRRFLSHSCNSLLSWLFSWFLSFFLSLVNWKLECLNFSTLKLKNSSFNSILIICKTKSVFATTNSKSNFC